MEDITNREKETVGDVAFQWLRNRANYMKWKGPFWKDTKVPELIEAEKNGTSSRKETFDE